MTNEEARKIRSAYNNRYDYTFGCGLFERCDMDEANRHAALDEANRHAALLDAALEKQIPKEITVKEGANGYDLYICPNCGLRRLLRIYRFCAGCGQRLAYTSTYGTGSNEE